MSTKEQKKFLFEKDFVDELEREEQERLASLNRPKEPTFNNADLAAARQQGFEDGRQQGILESKQLLETQILKALNTLEGKFQAVSQDLDTHLNQIEEQFMLAMNTIFQKVVPAYLDRHGLGEIESLATECIEMAYDQPALLVQVNPQVMDEMRRRLTTQMQHKGLKMALEITPKDDMGMSDCHIRWGGKGGVERTTSDILKQIERMIATHLSPRDATTYAATTPPAQDAVNTLTDAPATPDVDKTHEA